MQLIIPMAGIGKRMRPHSLTVPKPLLPVAGKPIVERLIEELLKVTTDKIVEIAFVVGYFGNNVENKLISIAEKHGAKGVIYYQSEPLGTAHAILCAEPSLKNKVVVIFADTLFKADFIIDATQDAIIFVKKVENPESFGVVKVNEENIVTDFIEKPKKPVSNLAIIGLYYFKNAEYLKEELQYLIKNNIVVQGEYQLTDVLQNMKNKGIKIKASVVSEWFDCGNKDAMVYTNQRILELNKEQNLISNTVKKSNSIIINPCYIGENVKITNSIIGPYVSIGEKTIINNSVIKNSIIQTNSLLDNVNIENSMLGNHVEYKGDIKDVNLGDYTKLS